jgi:hypothetical protein
MNSKKKKSAVKFKEDENDNKNNNQVADDDSQNIKPDWYVIGEYRISHTCIDETPCLHYVYLKDSEVVYVLNGKDIYKLLNRSKLSLPHFEKYKEIIDINPLSFLCCGLY